MAEILAELRAEPDSKEWSGDLDRLSTAASTLGTLAGEASAEWTRGTQPQTALLTEVALPTVVHSAQNHAGSGTAFAYPTSLGSRSRTLATRVRLDLRNAKSKNRRTNPRWYDNLDNRDMLSRRLEREGYTVDTAENGREALEKLEAGGFDLVLLDIVMPELDGFAVLQRIRSNQRWKEVAVIMISALDEIRSVVRCIEMGAEDYLQKPFDPVLLRARIGAILDRKRLRDEELLRRAEVETALQEAERQKRAAEEYAAAIFCPRKLQVNCVGPRLTWWNLMYFE